MKITKKQSLLFLIVLMLFTQRIINAQTWEEIGFNLPPGDSTSYSTNITFSSKNNGWLYIQHYRKSDNTYNKKLYKTTDGGESWTTFRTEINSIYYNTVVYSIEPDFFYMINGIDRPGYSSKAIYTSDGGVTWDSTKISNEVFTALHFFTEEKGVAISGSNSFLTTDGGKTWNRKGEVGLEKDIYFYNEKIGWMAGEGPYDDGGHVVKTTDGGNTWAYSTKDASPLTGITFIDSLNGFTVGAYTSELVETTDGGENWQIVGTNIYGFDIGFMDDKNGWISSWGQILKTTDGGENWEAQFDTLLNHQLVKLMILKKYTAAYVLGVNPTDDTATLLKADLSNITGVEENNETIPSEFYLFQNYPNPFNPTTSIEYQVSRHEMVTLKIYDVLGREIATLVNETKPPGIYKVSFDGSHLVSGIYIARLTAGKFSKAIKLTLMK